MKLGRKSEVDKATQLQIAPLIDVVFLLLIYFMVTASLVKKEGDISFILPANVQAEKVDVPVEALIDISADGEVSVEGLQFPPDDRMLDDMVVQLKGLQMIADNQQTKFFVNLIPEKDTLHERIIDVMDACAAAGVTNLSFSKSM